MVLCHERRQWVGHNAIDWHAVASSARRCTGDDSVEVVAERMWKVLGSTLAAATPTATPSRRQYFPHQHICSSLCPPHLLFVFALLAEPVLTRARATRATYILSHYFARAFYLFMLCRWSLNMASSVLIPGRTTTRLAGENI